MPTFLVVGAARAGTTALVEGLRTHPGVFVTEPKEPHYFALHGARPAFTGPGDEDMVNAVAVTDRAGYRALYPADPTGFVALGEGSTSTLHHHARSVPEIREVCPDARFVAILRDPVERALSAYDYLVSRGYETAPTLLDAVDLEPTRVAAGYHHLWHYVGMGRYADGVAAFTDAFGADRLTVVFAERLAEDYAGTVSEVLRFLGTAPHPGEAEGVGQVNSSGAPRSRLLGRGVQAVAGSPRLRAAVKRHTSFELRERVRTALLRRNPVTREVRDALQPLFADDLHRLRDLLPTQDLPPWVTRA